MFYASRIGCLINYIIVIATINSWKANAITSSVTEAFEEHEVVPDVVPVAPVAPLIVMYPSGAEVQQGNELTSNLVVDTPTVSWEARPVSYYTLAFVDADAPSRTNSTYRLLLHWLIVNIPVKNVDIGTTIAEYIGSRPLENSGLHRYVFLVYEQPSRLIFSEPYIANNSTTERRNFSIVNFASRYNLGDPIAGNFFQAQFSEEMSKYYTE